MKKLDLNEINIMVVCSASDTTAQYKKHLRSMNIRHYTLSAGNHIENIPQIIPINGVLVDIASFIKLDSQEKYILKEMEKIYPFARIKWDAHRRDINLMHHRDDINTVKDFIEKEARYFDPRIMRNAARKEIPLNVTLSNTRDLTGIQEKSCTLNISDNGLFIITSSRKWEEGQKVYVVINELTHKTPLEGTIVRKIEWGEQRYTTPGISVRIDSILDNQQDELMDLQ
ncbi:MAG: PilZ domain-containing protein [Fibrobacterota bacterium]